MQVTVHIDPAAVMHEMSDEDLLQELRRRKSPLTKDDRDLRLTLVYEEFVRRGDAPPVLKEYIYDFIGRIL